MLWPACFFAFVATYLILNAHWVFGFIFALGLAIFFVWLRSKVTLKFFILTIFASSLGAGFAKVRFMQKPQGFIESGTGQILSISKKSVVISTISFPLAKLRLTGLSTTVGYRKGDQIQFICKTLETQSTLFDEFEKLQGISYRCRSTSFQLIATTNSKSAKLREVILKSVDDRLNRLGDDSLAAAFLLGDTSDLDAHQLALFRDMGLMHLFAVSGLNIALLFAIIFLPFQWLRLPKVGYATGFIFCTLFLLLLDFSVPLFRAWFFLLAAAISKIFDRRPGVWIYLFFTAVMIEILIPYSTFTFSFLLSFSVTAAILLLYQPVFFCLKTKFMPKLVTEHIALTLAAGLPAMVISFFLFQQANPLSLVYNLILVPFSGAYLFATLVYLVASPVEFVIRILDWIYWQSLGLHEEFFSNYFPVADPTIQNWTILFALVGLICFLYFHLRQRMWTIRHRFALAILVIGFINLIPYFYMRYPQEVIWARPNQVMQLKAASWSLIGEPLFANDHQLLSPECMPRKKFEKLLTITQPIAKGVYRDQNACFVFLNRMQPESWSADVLSRCITLDFFQPRNLQKNATEWQKVFSTFGFRGKLRLRNYYIWYTDQPLQCRKTEVL